MAGAAADFNGTIDDVMIFNRSLSLEEIQALYANTSTTYLEHNFTNLTDAEYNFKAYVQDIAGNVNSTVKREVTVETDAPLIVLNSPVENTNFNTSSVTFNWTATDATNITCNLTIDGLVNKSDKNVTSGVSYNETVEGLSDSVHYWNVTCWDSYNQTDTSSTYKFLVDTVFPTINFTNPTPDDGNITRNDWIYVNVTANDTNNISTFIDFDDSLISWWRMDDVNQTEEGALVEDYMNRNNGTAVNDAKQTDVGYFGKGFEFDTKSDVIDISDIDYATISVSLWYYYGGTGGTWNTLLCRDGGSYHHMLIQDSTNEIGFYNGAWYSSTYSLTASNWYHIVLVKNGTNSKIYVNTDLKQDSGSSFSNSAYPLSRIGNRGGVNTQGSLGTIDDVMVFNRSLSDEEIAALYANTSTKYLEHNFTSLADGNRTFKAYVQDIAGNVNSTVERGVTVETDAPLIVLNSPGDNSNFNTSSVTFNWTATDATNITCNLTIDGLVNKSNLNLTSGVPYNETVEGLSDSPHYWNVTCWDSYNQTDTSSTYKFLVDTVFPTINFTNPTPDDGNITQNDWIYVNVTANDSANNISTFIDLDDSLVSWWRFDDLNGTGHPTDYVGRNNGTVVGNARQVTNGYFGRGFEFDGSGEASDSIRISHSSSLTMNDDITISAWVKPNSFAGDPMVVAHNNDAYANTMLYYFDSAGRLKNIIGTETDTSAYAISTGEWSHVAWVFDDSGNRIYYYINGTSKDSDSKTSNPSYSNGYWWIGAECDGAPCPDGNYFNGTIDDVMIFNRSLSAEEIAALYANSSTKYLEHNFTSLLPGTSTRLRRGT
jgi:hypothetical protein